MNKATKELDLCRGTGASLDKKYSEGEEIQVLWLQQAASKGRNNHIIFYKCDREKLKPETYINDNLIDLWMCWITRKESRSKICVHIFSTHFYNTLVNEGEIGVSKWTTRKGLDIFTKKKIMIHS